MRGVYAASEHVARLRKTKLHHYPAQPFLDIQGSGEFTGDGNRPERAIYYKGS